MLASSKDKLIAVRHSFGRNKWEKRVHILYTSRYQWHMIQCKNISRQADYSVMNPCENAFERSMRVLSLVNSMVNTKYIIYYT